MNSTFPHLTGDLARAGRALAQISHFVVARQAGLDPDRFRSFERGATHLKEDELEAARQALERSEEHTSELQSRGHLVCRLLLAKKKADKLAILSYTTRS